MEYTCQSEYLPLCSVVLNPTENSFLNQEKLSKEWRQLNYVAKPDFDKAQEEYGQFEMLLRHQGVAITYLPRTNETSADAIFCRDASIVTDHGVILCNMGKVQRRKEPKLHKAFYSHQHIPILGGISAPGTLEGGDVAWLDQKTLAVARSYRTNDEGIAQLKTMLEPLGIQVLTADLPHYKGPSDVFHLMSVLSPVARDLAVVYSPLLPIRFREELRNRGYQFVEVSDKEFDSMGCNVLALSPKTCMMVCGNPITEAALKRRGYEVLTYQGDEISKKGGGGPTCLTRPLKRSL